MRFVYFMCFAIGFSPIVFAEPVTTTVDGGYSHGKHLQCKAYLSKPTQMNQGTPTLVFFEGGTGVYTTYFDHLKNDRDYYFLSIDKPGVLPDLKNPSKPIVDRASFDYYTINNLVNCTQNALYWADDYLKNVKIKIILHGHSEGTSVMTNVVYNIYSGQNKKHLQDDIKALFLSGVVVEHMSDVLTFQFKGEEREKFMQAYQKHDSDFLYNNYSVGWYWLDDVLHGKQSNLITLSALTTLAKTRALPIEIFQGLHDEDVSTREVQELEKRNHDNPENQKLNLLTRYYNAGHSLNESALLDVKALYNYYFSKTAQS